MLLRPRHDAVCEAHLDAALTGLRKKIARLQQSRLTRRLLEDIVNGARAAWANLYTAILISGNQGDARGRDLRQLLERCERSLAAREAIRPNAAVTSVRQRIAFYSRLLRLLHDIGFDAVDEVNRGALEQTILASRAKAGRRPSKGPYLSC